jgi:hypothetical protein
MDLGTFDDATADTELRDRDRDSERGERGREKQNE